MGKSKKFNANKFKKKTKNGKYESAVGSDDETLYNNDEGMSDEDSDALYDDEIDKFHKEKEHNLKSKSTLKYNDSDSDDPSQSEEEIMPIQSSDEDEEEEEGLEQKYDDDQDEYDSDDDVPKSKFEVEYQKEQMASDIEDSEDDGLPDASAWGKKKSMYYNTDYVDKDFRQFKETDEEQAKYEEEEAIAIQKRLYESMNDADLGIGLLVGDVEPRKETEKIHDDDALKEDKEKRIQLDIASLTEREKKELLNKESPELNVYIDDLKFYMNEIKEKFEPLMNLVQQKKIPNHTVSRYIDTRYHLTSYYCTNILFYLSMKSKRIQMDDHPILKRLQEYKNLIKQLDNITSNKICSVNKDIKFIVKKIELGQELTFDTEDILKRKNKSKDKKQVKRVKFADSMETHEFNENIDDEDEDNEKRAITYEMSKNRGLTPKRKKELRNPRVKHRMKYRKAKIRRKGQVREPRKEVTKYAGEISGIKSRVVKSIKFK